MGKQHSNRKKRKFFMLNFLEIPVVIAIQNLVLLLVHLDQQDPLGKEEVERGPVPVLVEQDQLEVLVQLDRVALVQLVHRQL